MAMNHRLLRPLRKIVTTLAAYLLTTISGDTLTDMTGDTLRTIQNA